LAIHEVGRPRLIDRVEEISGFRLPKTLEWELIVPSNLHYADRAAVAVLRQVHQVVFHHRLDVPIRLAVVECLSNAIEHGNRFQARKVVYLRVRCNRRAIQIVIRDQGEGFDPAEKRSLEQLNRKLKERGRGLHIIRHLMDEVRYFRDGREVRLIKRLTAGRSGLDRQG